MRPRALRWSLILGGVAVVAIGIVIILFARNWPFTRQAVTAALQDRFARTVEIQNFRRTYFPPGFVAEGISFEHRKRKDLPPLITVRTLVVKASYIGMLRPQKHLGEVKVVGLHVTVPPKNPNGQPSPVMPLTDSNENDTLAIGEISTNDALLEFMPSQGGGEPFKMDIQRLSLSQVGGSGSISFRASLANTEPPGEIHSTGEVGPWNEDDPGSMPISGSYTFERANLGVFAGIAGTLSSKGKFSGTLGRVETEGGVDVPDFHVSGSKHIVQLSTEFRALVDGTNGDTNLQSVKSHFESTTALASGRVAGQAGQHGKAVALEMTVKDGRVDDLLRLVTQEKTPSMTGSASFHASIKVPPGPPGFLKKLALEGDFGLGNDRFTNAAVQAPLNKLTESARGESKQQQADDPETVLSDLKGHVSVKNGIATLSNVTFNAPGTFAQIRGTYNLLTNAVNLQGVLRTNGTLSDTTSGFKAVVLKAVGPLLKKKTVTMVPFTITGTSMKPSFGLDLAAKRKF